MTTATDHFLQVPGARLYYRIEGEGPFLLLLQGGDGDANGMSGLVSQLKTHFTIITYDRRGLSQSVLEEPVGGAVFPVHAEDVHQLLLHLDAGPVYVFGNSFGALLGIELSVHYPGQVRLLIAHEPPLTQFLSAAGRVAAAEQQEAVEIVFREQGIPAAMQMFARLAGFNLADREPDVELPTPSPQRAANLAFFLTYDAPAVRTYTLEPGQLYAVGDKILPAVGETSSGQLAHRCTEAIAAFLDKEVYVFPGGHNGFLTHPRAFAAVIRRVLGR